VDGAICVAHPRIPENISLEGLAERYPRLKSHLGPVACTEESAKGARRPCCSTALKSDRQRRRLPTEACLASANVPMPGPRPLSASQVDMPLGRLITEFNGPSLSESHNFYGAKRGVTMCEKNISRSNTRARRVLVYFFAGHQVRVHPHKGLCQQPSCEYCRVDRDGIGLA
jgi:hypothetical protein